MVKCNETGNTDLGGDQLQPFPALHTDSEGCRGRHDCHHVAQKCRGVRALNQHVFLLQVYVPPGEGPVVAGHPPQCQRQSVEPGGGERAQHHSWCVERKYTNTNNHKEAKSSTDSFLFLEETVVWCSGSCNTSMSKYSFLLKQNEYSLSC